MLELTGGVGWSQAFADLPTASNSFAGGRRFHGRRRSGRLPEVGLGRNLAADTSLSHSYGG